MCGFTLEVHQVITWLDENKSQYIVYLVGKLKRQFENTCKNSEIMKYKKNGDFQNKQSFIVTIVKPHG